jgi:hypothetical protein
VRHAESITLAEVSFVVLVSTNTSLMQPLSSLHISTIL